ncbi:MAG: disulfide bond formation protein B [Gammaproteobacteria bacterium]|nr:disulfide bond formation protein B [Gammaproteobacteria bacterium]MCP4088848.1 disulfide bond formation protein B [Gammaproteobacteria bacterium]MCP4274864.1 disulfide bond formation protein B [Gammaproteobacteria bacterium]MCP4832069.1 disulfide bond formation protein B [Gammaproteobacteria bacterium]MCP4928330.1 disulfide bond formation protein B [Gammaproteobacteria bacterium]
MNIPDKRILNLAGFSACAGLMMYALYAQYFLDLSPCPLCVFQRISVIALGVIFLIASLHNVGRVGSVIYALLVFLAASAGVIVAGRHIWLQSLPPDKVPACGPGLDFMLDAFPVAEALIMVFSGSGECAEISWSLLGLSMPAWVLIAFVLLGLYGVWVNLRRGKKYRPEICR